MSLRILSVSVTHEHDIVAARQRARQITAMLGFEAQDQTRVATAVSEIARNAFRYAAGGRVEFTIEGRTAPQVLQITVIDGGPGVSNLGAVLAGRYKSSTGMGMGIIGARRLMDRFQIDSTRSGTTVRLSKLLPLRAPIATAASIASLVNRLAAEGPQNLLEELQQQNQELLRALEELRLRQEDLTRLNAELEDTNRGVVALYAELDEKADHLRRADEMKSRFLSNMSHEFRTPLNSMLALTRLLVERADGELTGEQETQVLLIQKAAQDLSDLVNDLLDLAKVEAGKIVVRPVEFQVTELFGALRGMLRPLLVNESIALVFEAPDEIPALYTDEAKVSQILRNFISNALKFTERGEVRVSARLTVDGEAVVFSVADTGIGIPPEHHQRIFQEFAQLDNAIQKRVRGTGLGLPLSCRLAELLGGRLTLESQPGVGSTFCAVIPIAYREHPPSGEAAAPEPIAPPPAGQLPVLIVEDSPDDLLLYEKYLRRSEFHVLPARSPRDARRILQQAHPVAIVLDILFVGEHAWQFLTHLKQDERTRDIPVIVATTVDDQPKALALGADAYAMKPIRREWLLETLRGRAEAAETEDILVIDDEEASRYLLRHHLAETKRSIREAVSGAEGLAMAQSRRPALIVLDLVMPGLSGGEVLDRLKADPQTSRIPVIVATSKRLTADERQTLEAKAVRVVSKETLSERGAGGHLREALVKAGLTSG